MSERQHRWIALLRGINVGGHTKIPMAELRELCGELGWEGMRTYIQSGNIVFDAAGPGGALEARLAEAIAGGFGLDIPVIVRAVAGSRCRSSGIMITGTIGRLAINCHLDGHMGKFSAQGLGDPAS